MNKRSSRITAVAILALAMLAPPSSAQQKMAPASPQVPVVSQAPVVAAPAPIAQAPVASPAQPAMPSAAAPPAPPATDATAAPADGGNKPPKSTVTALRELSPWSMFLSADILVKAVMVGLAFASLVTWTIFIAKMIELTVIQRKLRTALGRISDARSLAEAQFALGAKDGVLTSLLAAAMREARLSAGISSDSGIKERAASSFAEIVRAEARRIRLDHEPRRRRTRHRRSAARHRVRPCRRDPGRHHLQSFLAGDEGLPRTGRPVVGRSRAIIVARSRSHPCQFSRHHAFARGGVGHGRLAGRHRTRRRQRFRRNA